MKCYAIVPAEAALLFSQATWITLSSGSVLLVQDADYSSFTSAVATAGGSTLPMFYDPTALTDAQRASVAPIALPSGAAMLQLAGAAASLNPLLSL
jgi:hypothetical protein